MALQQGDASYGIAADDGLLDRFVFGAMIAGPIAATFFDNQLNNRISCRRRFAWETAMKRVWTLVALILPLLAQSRAKPLEIYVVDVEGGKADLWVTPTGQTLLIDTGSPGGRDTDRIQEVMAAAGVHEINYLLTTHYHVDHAGGLQELVKRIPPIGHFLDHGPTVEDGAEGHQREQVPGFQAAYAEIYGKSQHTVLKVGDKIPLPGVDWRIVTSAGKVTKTSLPGGGKPSAECAGVARPEISRDPENAQSVGSVISYGGFRALDFGDLTGNIEYDLVCPSNPIGTVDLFFASNHGLAGANIPPFVHTIAPRVVIVQNSAGKGASIDMFKAMRTSRGLEDIWTLHWGNAAGIEWNSPGALIANGTDPATLAAVLTAPAAPTRGGGPPHAPAYWVKISVERDGSFTVTNSRNSFSRSYAARAK